MELTGVTVHRVADGHATSVTAASMQARVDSQSGKLTLRNVTANGLKADVQTEGVAWSMTAPTAFYAGDKASFAKGVHITGDGTTIQCPSANWDKSGRVACPKGGVVEARGVRVQGKAIVADTRTETVDVTEGASVRITPQDKP